MKNILINFLGVALFLCVLGSSSAYGKANPEIQRGIDLFREGKISEAIDTLDSLLKSNTLDKYETSRVQSKLDKYREYDRLQNRYLELAREKQLRPDPDKIPAGANRYVVRPGDTLWLIASYGYVYNDITQGNRIYQANRNTLSDPDLLYPGQVLIITR